MDGKTVNRINARLDAIEWRIRDMQSDIRHLHLRMAAYPDLFKREMRFTRTSLRYELNSLATTMQSTQQTVQFLRGAAIFGPDVALTASVEASAARRAERTRAPTELELRERELARKVRAIAGLPSLPE